MCNTQSNVYLQLMKTYPLSVNALMWNLTSKRHDNCAPCLDLILPIRWVPPPPNSYWSVSLGVTIAKSSHLDCLQHWFVFMIYLCNVELAHIFIAMSSLLNLDWSKWMWSDPNLLCASTSIISVQIICILLKPVDCLHWVLVRWCKSDKHLICF